ncbi:MULTISPECIES: helix-turn-helix domain-containing protein [unclassified Nostoc]|nr:MULTISPECIES: helix-turn-helix transcriptional regulator [unclassified Nostoc]MDZ8140479.1 helix-turn-helix transcriptional regulator [Nostoc sp. DedQUE04]QLE53592.1 helix-turn-helix transcriptional regulator [Nostoc sp. C057]
MRKMHCRLAVLMAEKNPTLSLAEVARSSNISYPAVYRLFTNDFKRVDTETIEKLCDYFRCDLADLFELREVIDVSS